MSCQPDERFPVSGCVAEYRCICEQTGFQITPLLGKPKKRTEKIILAEYSKTLCIPFSTYHQPKQGISAILIAEGKSSNLNLPFSFFLVLIGDLFCLATLNLYENLHPSLSPHPFLYSTWMALEFFVCLFVSGHLIENTL